MEEEDGGRIHSLRQEQVDFLPSKRRRVRLDGLAGREKGRHEIVPLVRAAVHVEVSKGRRKILRGTAFVVAPDDFVAMRPDSGELGVPWTVRVPDNCALVPESGYI